MAILRLSMSVCYSRLGISGPEVMVKEDVVRFCESEDSKPAEPDAQQDRKD